MASDDSSGPRSAAPIVLRIKLRYDDVEVMVQKFATNVGKSGLFLPTKSLQPIGAEIKFELRLADDTPALVGLGRVKAATPPDPTNPRAAFGMAVELMRVTPQSRALILRMLERRRAMGLPEVGLPMTADIEAARRAEAVAGGRDPASGPVPVVTPAPAPAAMPAPIAALDAPSGEALMTAPRRTTGPMAVAKVPAVAPLAPELPRRKRIAMSQIIESASGPIASIAVAVPGLDDDVDLAAALARARALAGGGAIDAELEALAEVAAAPLEISVEAASAELARQLGGNAVRRDRSARWAAPPATTSTAAPPPAQAEPGVEPLAEPAAAEPASAASTAEPVAAEPAAAEAAEPGVEPLAAEPASAAPPADDRAEPPEEAAFALPDADPVIAEPGQPGSGVDDHDVAPGRTAEDLHPPGELDLEDGEHTELGDMPVDPVAQGAPGEPHGDPHGTSDEPSPIDHQLLEAQLAEAEAAAEADIAGLAAALGAAADDDPAAGYVADAGYELPRAGDELAEPPVDLNLEEIDDFEILAEADADDEDLLAAHGEQDASDSRERLAPPAIAVRRARVSSELDFAARLDLGDDSDRHFVTPDGEFSAHHVLDAVHDDLVDRLADSLIDDLSARPRPRDPLLESAGHALAGFDTSDEPLDEPAGRDSGHDAGHVVEPMDEPESTGSFTIAGIPSDSLDLEPPPPPPPPAPVRIEPARMRAARSQRASAHGEPRVLQPAPSPLAMPSLHGAPVEDHELEHALEALDVDLDDLSIPHAATQLQRAGEPAKPIPVAAARSAPRAQGRALKPTPVPTSAPTPSRSPSRSPSPAPSPTASPAPSRPGRQPAATPVAPSPGRVVAPRVTTEDGVLINFDDDDD